MIILYMIFLLPQNIDAYHLAEYGQYCSDPSTRITKRAACQAAAADLGLDWGNGWWGPGDFAGCLYTRDSRKKVYFNYSPHASNDPSIRPNYAEMCTGAVVPPKKLAEYKALYGQHLEDSMKALKNSGDIEEHVKQYAKCGPRNIWTCFDEIVWAIYFCKRRNSPGEIKCQYQCVKSQLKPQCLECISKVCVHIPFACEILPNLCCKKENIAWETVPGSECNRDCTNTTHFYNCEWTFKVEKQYSDQPGRMVDGRYRSVVTYNGTIPGPSIVVCELDTVKISIENRIEGSDAERDGQSNGTTLHMHGIRRWTQSYEDGVPGINQCEIPSNNDKPYKYTMIAYDIHENAPQGTYWYHSHVGSQRTNGLYGALIIKPRCKIGPYDVDEAENTLVLQEWYLNQINNTAKSILINGKGRVQGTKVPITNYSEFDVEYNLRYRFRIIGAISQNFPLCVSIENHKFTAIATDSIDFKPVKNVGVVCLTAGERYDIVIKTRKTARETPYKIKVFGKADYGSLLCTVAWLKYPGQTVNQNYTPDESCTGFKIYSSQKVLNPVMNHEFENNTKQITVDELIATRQPLTIQNTLQPTHYVVMNDLTFNNMEMTYNEVPFLFQNPANLTNRCGPKCDEYFHDDTLNFTCKDLPLKPDHCTEKNESRCQCEHVVHQPHVPGFLGEFYWFETILINPNDSGIAHPIHQHGGWYNVLAVKQFDKHIAINKTYIEEQDKICAKGHNCLPRNLDWPIQKDTIQVPVNGYVIFRTPLDNAGTWIVHCHINHHVESGMAMVFQIGGLPVKFHLEGSVINPLPLPTWSQDWSLGPYKDDQNKKCSIKLDTYRNPDFIQWFYGMKPIEACADPGHSINFRWLYDHNVNQVNETVWDTCEGFVKPNQTTREIGGWLWPGNETSGTYYFACGVDDGYHCKHGGLKAKFTVPCD